MRRTIVASAVWLLVLTVGAQAACGGRNILTDLAPGDRARLDVAVAAAPYPAGNHWRAKKAGSTVTVIGTFHMADPRMAGLIDRLGPEIAGADAIYLEATRAEMAALQEAVGKRPDLLFVNTGPTLPERLDADEWQQVSREMAARGIPPFMASKFQPWYVTVLLGTPACAMEALSRNEGGLDTLIMDSADAAGVPTRALEPYDTVFHIFSTLSDADQLDMVRAALPMTALAEDMFATLTAAYFSQDHRLIWELSRQQALDSAGTDTAAVAEDFALMEEALLTGRNRAWMDVILPAAEGHEIVVAVGAAHLSGDAGLLNLLQRAGYSLERLPF
jgi:uncharacterized protein YbaP (TraB family)